MSEEFKTMMMKVKRAERDREVGLGLYCEHLPLDCEGRMVCHECCDHSGAQTGLLQWNGLNYCSDCCEHNFGHRNFIEHPGDGFNTCTLCWIVVGQHISVPPHPEGMRKKKPVRLIKPRTTLTKCDGKPGRVLTDK